MEGPAALAVELAQALTETPAQVSADLYEKLQEAFSREALVELACAITWKNYLARFNRLYEMKGEDFPGL